MLTEKDYCDYCDQEIENELVRLGFPIKQAHLQGCGVCVTMHISLYEAQKWLRKEKHIEVVVLSKGMVGAPYYFQVYTEDFVVSDDKEYSSYEDAFSEGIKEVIKILKEE